MKKQLFAFALFSVLIAPITFAQMMDDAGTDMPEENNTELTDATTSAPVEDSFSDLFTEDVLEETGGTTNLDNLNNAVEELEGALKSSAGIPGVLPTSSNVTLSVVNVSQENKDAQVVGARPGDILRYELKLNSDSEDVMEYISKFDVKAIMNAVDFTNIGLAELDRVKGLITFPAYTHKAPCEQIFTLFAQVKPDCGDLRSLKVSAEGKNTNVKLSCQLAPTGSFSQKHLIFGMIAIMFMLAFGAGMRRKA